MSLRFDGGSRRRRLTSAGIDTGALPIRDRHCEEHEKSRGADVPIKAGSKKSGRTDDFAMSVSRVWAALLVDDSICC